MDRKVENKDEILCFQQENILQHMGLIKNIARQMKEIIPQEMSWEDVVQYGCIGLIEAVRNYDEEKGKLSTLATKYIYGSIIEGIYAFQGQKRLRNRAQRNRYKTQLSESGEDWMLQEQLRIEEERQQRVQEEVEERFSLKKVLGKLALDERRLIEAIYFQNKTCEMYAVEEQKSAQWAKQMHRRVLRKLRLWMLN